MRYVYQPSFLAAAQSLSRAEADTLLKAVEKFQSAIESRQWPPGLGLTHLRADYFEFRVNIHTRVVYQRSADLVRYVLYGNHDEIRRFLKAL